MGKHVYDSLHAYSGCTNSFHCLCNSEVQDPASFVIRTTYMNIWDGAIVFNTLPSCPKHSDGVITQDYLNDFKNWISAYCASPFSFWSDHSKMTILAILFKFFQVCVVPPDFCALDNYLSCLVDITGSAEYLKSTKYPWPTNTFLNHKKHACIEKVIFIDNTIWNQLL